MIACLPPKNLMAAAQMEEQRMSRQANVTPLAACHFKLSAGW
jgi:hypothetical protein